jgi:hypothetical protein
LFTLTGFNKNGKDLLLSAIMVVDTLDGRAADIVEKAAVEPSRHAEMMANLVALEKKT